MAGVYADIPGTRFALDQDGSVANVRNVSTGSAWTNVTSSLGAALDAGNEDYIDIVGVGEDQSWEFTVGFPEPRTINGLFLASAAGAGGTNSNIYYYSTDTTDGTDGTWTTFTGPNWIDSSGSFKPYYRANIAAFGPLTAVKGIQDILFPSLRLTTPYGR
jgi:hypothetical protein